MTKPLTCAKASCSGRIDPKVVNYESPVPLFRSGTEAAAHGMKNIGRPDAVAKRTIARLVKKQKGY